MAAAFDPTARHSRCAQAQRGSSFVELMAAVAIVGVALMIMLQQLTISYRENGVNEDRTFAYQRAAAILAEIQSAVERESIPDSEHLDRMEDLAENAHLSTLVDENGDALPPDHIMSGNIKRLGHWLWSRKIEIEPPPGQETLRHVKVVVSKRDERSGKFHAKAAVAAMISVQARTEPATKVYDLYVLNVASAPSMWMDHGSLKVLIQNAAREIETIDNGLRLRLHWITKMGYGRDPAYVPYSNTEQFSTTKPPGVYWYPSKLDGPVVSKKLYTPEFFSGRYRDDQGEQNSYEATANPHPHTIADQFNHCLRTPRAQALFEARLASGQEDPDELPLQLFLNELKTNPERFRNAIIVNLHGAALPIPPMRNYSDAAKDPLVAAGVRVVTHPAKLHTARDGSAPSNSEAAEFRVYAYKTDPDAGPTYMQQPVTVKIFGMDLSMGVNTSLGSLHIDRMTGGVNPVDGTAGVGDYVGFDSNPAPTSDGGMAANPYCEVGYDVTGNYTWIRLHNTALVCPPVAGKGLDPSARLYGMDYIPSPVVASSLASAFPRDLASTSGTGTPKNTARWRIRIQPKGAVAAALVDDIRLEVQTSIGDTASVLSPGANPASPHNESTTYTWWSASPDAVPATERYQFEGDPRHSPYADLTISGTAFRHGYNWHFDDLRDTYEDASVKWPALDRDRLADGFGGGAISDVPRYLQLYREAVQASGALFVQPISSTAAVVVQGGEIGLPCANTCGPVQTIPLSGQLGGFTGNAAVDSLTPQMTVASSGSSGASIATTMFGRQLVMGHNGMAPFWSQEWLGELCPDDQYAYYLAHGNLPVGQTPGEFVRAVRNVATLNRLPSGTDFRQACGAVVGSAGGVSLMHVGTLSQTFVHEMMSLSTEGDTQPALTEIANALGEEVPASFPAAVPFTLTATFPGLLPHFAYTDTYAPNVPSELCQFVRGEGGVYSAGLFAVESTAVSGRGFFSIHGLTPQDATQHEAVARSGLMMALRAFHHVGNPAIGSGRVVQVPQLEILNPADGVAMTAPATIPFTWRTRFVRFDGEKLTETYPEDFSEAENEWFYVIKVSNDGGQTWEYALNRSQKTLLGERPPVGPLRIPDAVTGDESYNLPTPSAAWPPAEYQFKVEAHHITRQVHHAVHHRRITIQAGS